MRASLLLAASIAMSRDAKAVGEQHPIAVPLIRDQAAISIDATWEALGPFPSGTREHPFLSSPAYAFLPNRSSHPHDLDRTFASLAYGWSPQEPKYRNNSSRFKVEGKGWPSALGVDGVVGWERFETGKDGYTAISYPDVRWDQLRAHQGWAALQFQSLLRTNVTIASPSPITSSTSDTAPVLLDMELIQGQEFALIPHGLSPNESTSGPDHPITWYNGDIYSYGLSVPNAAVSSSSTSAYAHQLLLRPGQYTLLVRAIFEIRMFGDPGAGVAPVVKFLMRGAVITPAKGRETYRTLGLERREELDLIGDVMDGWLVGSHVGLGVRAYLDIPLDEAETSSAGSGITEILGLRLADPKMAEIIRFNLISTLNYGTGLAVRVYPGQVRVLAVSVEQFEAISEEVNILEISITARRCQAGSKDLDDCDEVTIPAAIRLVHVPHFTSAEFISTRKTGIKFSHLSPTTSPIYSMLIPPLSSAAYPSPVSDPTLLALHGAGVEASSEEWLVEIPKQERGWAIVPTGGTSWGMDWHGASMESAMDALEKGRRWIEVNYGGGGEDGWGTGREAILLGHSNGGQGAWHVAARHPDKFLGVIPGAGYLKIQDYVSYDTWTSDNYADPSLMGILRSALTPFDNDLHASNLAHVSIHAIHGEEDDNVPVSSTRKHTGLVGAWSGGDLSVISYEEVPGANHWYPGFFGTNDTASFFADTAKEDLHERFIRMHQAGYTITTANPDETTGKGGIRIFELDIPGRLARIEVLPWRSGDVSPLQLRTRNVATFGMDLAVHSGIDQFEINGEAFSAKDLRGSGRVMFKRTLNGFAMVPDWYPTRKYGPLIRILSSPRPAVVIYGTQVSELVERLKSLAVRLVHSAQTYQRIEMDIIDDKTALEMAAMGQLVDRHIIVLGSPQENLFTSWMSADKGLPVSFPANGVFTVGDSLIYEAGSIIFLADHPSIPSSLACVIAGTDAAGLEAAFRLFPVRTGVPVPDWAIVGSKSAWQGAGGFLGAGFWTGDWQYSETMSYLA